MLGDAMQLTFVTYSGEPGIYVDDLPLARELESRGVVVRSCPWDVAQDHHEPEHDFIIRSAWNYDRAPAAFLQWLVDRENQGSRVINGTDIVRWNIHKDYLFEARDRGATLPRTCKFIPRSADPSALVSAFSRHDRVVLKPCISLSAHDTFLLGTGDIPSALRDLSGPDREYLLQEYVPEIAAGELSFVFFIAYARRQSRVTSGCKATSGLRVPCTCRHRSRSRRRPACWVWRPAFRRTPVSMWSCADRP